MADNIPDLQTQLQQPYDRKRWGQLLHQVFPSVSIFQVPLRVTKGCPDYVKDYSQLGSVRLSDGKHLAVFEVCVEDKVNLIKNRVDLRHLVAKHIDEGTTHGVLCVFNSSTPQYRFTFVAKETGFDEEGHIVTSETTSHRYTYILGPGETRRTAAQRFQELAAHRDHADLKEVMAAFSVERLNKEFFDLYKEHYRRFVDYIVRSTEILTKVFGVTAEREPSAFDAACKPVRDWVKQLLGRIVFIHFLQKKGWMGCSAGSKKWKDGEPQFLQNLFSSCREKDRFHSECLAPLFFDALNAPDRPGDIFPISHTRVPYLNGGLFEETLPAARAIDFPASMFQQLLDFFASYNFTIDENDPEEHEVGIDPEMLGHIFENLLEENKDKGAYYTPKKVVQFMCQEAVLLYLQTYFGNQDGLVALVRHKDAGSNDSHNWVRKNASRIEELLDKVKICDPAIGSGAFPIGLLQEIFWMKLALDWTLNDPAKFAAIKRQIIQDTIHGVDNDPGAIEIARLRCWLAIVVDEVEPVPLPNLDYKIHCADSLVEYLRGEPVNRVRIGTEDAPTKTALSALLEAKRVLFSATRRREKRVARQALFLALARLGQAEFTWLRNEEGLFGDGQRAVQLDRALREFSRIVAELMSAPRLRASEQDALLDRTQSWFEDSTKPTFMWHLHFGEVFANGGFDIVIQNPPFVRNERLPECLKNELARVFQGLTRRSDLYCYFYLRSLHILKPSGLAVIISSNSWLDVGYGAELQQQLLTTSTILKIVDSSVERTFANADINTIICFIQRELPTETSSTTFISLRAPFNIAIYDESRQRLISRTNTQLLSEGKDELRRFTGGKWGGRYLRAPDAYWKILERAGSKLDHLGKFADITFGLKTGANSFFHVKLCETRRGAFIVGSQDGTTHELGPEVTLIPTLTKAKEIWRFRVTSDDCKYYLVCIPPNGLSPSTREYIACGERLGYHLRPSTSGRRPWWSIDPPATPALAFPSAHKRRPVIGVLAPRQRIVVDKRFYCISCTSTQIANVLAACLASTFSTLCREIHGRANFGQGMLEVIVKEAKGLPVLSSFSGDEIEELKDAFLATVDRRILMLYDDLATPERRNIDDAFLKCVGFRDNKERAALLDELADAAGQAIWNRQARAQNTREARMTFAEWKGLRQSFETDEDE